LNRSTTSHDPHDARAARERLSRLAWLLDSSIPVPGTGFAIGLDALIGLFPVVGDVVGVLLSSYILREAARLGVPKSTLFRMALNVGMEGLAGMIPVVGDVFDAAWKANQRNVRLLDASLERPVRTAAASRAFVLVLVLALVALVAAVGFVGFAILRWAWNVLAA
jgi:Domain of unknown function (DUF4112)